MSKRNKRKYRIVGIHKCGTVSLYEWMIQNGYDVIRKESLFNNDYEGWEEKPLDTGWHNLLLLREPAERAWSHFHYKQLDSQKGDGMYIDPNLTFIEALDKHPEIIDHSNYAKYIDIWKNTSLTVLWLENLKYLKGFPKLNKTSHSNMTEKDRKVFYQKLYFSSFRI